MRETGGDDLALLPVRGANVLYQLRVSPEGAISCADCAVPVGNTDHVDPYSVGVACGPGLARAYVGHLRSSSFSGWVTQVDLSRPLSDPGAVQHFSTGEGQVRGFAYDAEIERLYMTHTVAAGLPSRLRWVDLGGGCTVGEGLPAEGSCAEGFSVSGAVPNGLELRGIALASPAAPSGRVYLTARIHDPVASAASGVRVGDFDGMLLVADLLETLGGELDLAIVREIDLGYGAGEVVVLPRTDGRRDVVAALATDSGRLTIYDDDTGAVVAIGADLEGTDPTGAPLLGHVPVALAADPSVPGRLYVGSFQESFVTTIDVAVQATPATACLVAPGGGCAVGPDFAPRRISGGTP
jgi:hypothetical protein